MVDTPMASISSLPDTLVLWDVDHTLIDNGGISKETYRLAFELLVGRVPEVQPATDGRTDFQIMRELLVANSVDATEYVEISQFEGVLGVAMRENASGLPRRGRVLPGVVEALAMLAAVPTVVQSVLTGNIAHNAAVKLGAFGLDERVDMEVGGFGSDDKIRSNLVDAARRKVSLKYGTTFDRLSTILVGDTLLDVQAAHDGGAKIISVATGVHSAEQLREAGADVVLDSLADTERFMTELLHLRTDTTVA